MNEWKQTNSFDWYGSQRNGRHFRYKIFVYNQGVDDTIIRAAGDALNRGPARHYNYISIRIKQGNTC